MPAFVPRVFSRACLKTFRQSDDGAGTTYSLFTLAVMALLGGYAIDVSNVMTDRTNMQTAVDSVAHAALVTREMKSSDEARTTALTLAAKNLPAADWGTAIKAEDVVFGTWDETHRKFTANPNSRSAVRVTAHQTEGTGNPVPVFLLQFAGLDNWNVVTDAT